MTEQQVDLDAIEARAKTRQAIDSPDVLALIGELRQEREQHQEDVRIRNVLIQNAETDERDEIITGPLIRRIQALTATLSRAEEAIEKVRTVLAWAPDHDGSDPLRVQGDYMWRAQLADEALSVLTEYDKQKGADLG